MVFHRVNMWWLLVLLIVGLISDTTSQDLHKNDDALATPTEEFLQNPDKITDKSPVEVEEFKFPDSPEQTSSDIQNDGHDMMYMKKSFPAQHGGNYHGMFGAGYGGGNPYGPPMFPVKQSYPLGHQMTYGGASQINPMQGCAGKPNQPLNAMLKCTSNSNTCKATCMANYKFPNGETSLLISCVEGEWIVQGAEWPQVPSCEPICIPQCENNGICVSPGVCQCPENFRGPQCQHEMKFCLQKPTLPSNSRQTCTSTQCTISCAKGYRFPDGTTIANVVCREGEWTPTRGDLTTIPDCQPVCSPKCKNGGTCLAFNVCQCPPEYRGAQCQYSVENCAPKKLKFNGGYNCSGTGDTISCVLYCPHGVAFDSPPAPMYSCNYASGLFTPTTVPKCVFTDDMDIISLGAYKQSTQIRTGQTIHGGQWSYSGHHGGQDGGYQEIEITKTRKYKEGGGYQVGRGQGEEFEIIQLPGVYNVYISNDVGIVFRQPKPSICMTWNGNKVKTFDGLIYSSPLYCSHTLLHDQIDGAFSVIVRACPQASPQPCSHSLVIFLLNMMYTFENANGSVVFSSPKSQLPIPSQLTGIKVTMLGDKLKIVLESVQTSIIWDTQQLVVIEASASLWNRTSGLCGTMDMDVENDFMSKIGVQQKLARTFVDSWRTPNVDLDKSKCIMGQGEDMDVNKCDPIRKKKAEFICEKLVRSSKLVECLDKFNSDMLIQSCVFDYCFCEDKGKPEKCACDGVSVFAQDCVFQGVTLEHGWRDLELCPMSCPYGRIYKACGPSSEPSCGGATTNEKDSHCREGCFCPEGTIQHEGKCIDPFQCPCHLRGKVFKAGSQIKKDCNTCACDIGTWKCTDVNCGSRCGAIGDPHYVTFDGKRFDFMGKCSYRLFLTGNVTVDAENVACPGSISEAMGLIPTSLDMPSCTKSVTISYTIDNDKLRTIKLKQGRVVLVDEQEITKFPKTLVKGLLKIRQASSTFLSVEFQDGLKIWWDGVTRVYIDAPATYREKTKGLCGTFNSNQQDDFLTPEGDIESVVEPFADKWRTKETCQYITDSVPVPHPCQVNLENKSKAEQVCSKLKGKLFDDCHWYVDHMPFYEDCLYDVCACKDDDVNACMCPIFSSYAAECARQGVVINWRLSVPECGIKCPPGQVYEECGDSCYLTCEDLHDDYSCRKNCVEGCRCSQGQALNEDNECVPISACPCSYKGLTFRPGYKETRPGNKYLELCTCTGAKWDCVQAKDGDAEKYPPAADIRSKCLISNNEEFTTCEPSEPITCKNMHDFQESTPADCVAGCVCKKGFVLDMSTKKCVRPQDCSCHHGGVSYKDGDKVREQCNTCECKAGSWQCTKHQCPGICSSWGDSHFTTFDGRDFDFQGVCNYVLAKGSLGSNKEGFSVTIQNVLCGSLGETCSKSVHISIHGDEPESLTLSADSPIPGVPENLSSDLKISKEKPLKLLFIYRAGIFIVVDAPELGVQVKWDRGTRVYITIRNQWRGKVQGLCGNFNDDVQDDFKTPSAGIETNAVIFGDSWKLQDYCPKTTEQVDSCSKHPHRTMWAQRKCGILKSAVFQPCHSEVTVDGFLKRCTHDTCACDQGGDCECLCTALAAYAHACALKGVSIRWRTPDLCPMQCDPKCSSYSPCISTCPIETCDNVISPKLVTCSDDVCVEGCKLKGCPVGEIYKNESYSDCVQKTSCKPICMEVDGVTYYEGDVMSADLCQTCRCSRGKKICSGSPCPEEVSTPEDIFITLIPYQEEDLKCVSGWSGWINQDTFEVQGGKTGIQTKKKTQKIGDIEPIPTYLTMKNTAGASCSPGKIAKIECRTIGGHKSCKSSGENAECSLERGLVCEGPCSDYEIRVLCDCDGTYEVPVVATEAPSICDPTIPHVEYPGDCYKFYHCMPMPDGSWRYQEKTCGPTMMFNPQSMICDWVFSVKEIKPECGKPVVTVEPPRTSKCPPGQVWTDCVVPCDHTCHYYGYVTKKTGLCGNFLGCTGGCVNETYLDITCPSGGLWRDKLSCVLPNHCTCASRNGSLVKPGEVFRESECELCQCIDNTYICDISSCKKDEKVKYAVEVDRSTEPAPFIFTQSTTTETSRKAKPKKPKGPLVVPTTMSPPPMCDLSKYDLVPVVSGESSNYLPDSAFSASSTLGSSFQPHFGRIDSIPTPHSSGSWSPEVNNVDQYLQISFPQLTPLYGIQISGSPTYDHYVTMFKIFFSHDGVTFSCFHDESGVEKLFFGPVEHRAMIQNLFQIPIEAKVVRISPVKYHTAIAIRVELLGCGAKLPKVTQKVVTTTTTTTSKPITESTSTTARPTPAPIKLTTSIHEDLVQVICDDPMGIENGKMSPPQIKFSSSKANRLIPKTQPTSVEQLKLSSPKGWMPNLNTPNEYIIFDFLEKRNLTGIQVKGGDYGWVTAFTISYSQNEQTWNQILNLDGSGKLFGGCVDKYTVKTNMFKVPIQARYLKIVPVKWQEQIEMKVEPIGCYQPYIVTEDHRVIKVEPSTEIKCGTCSGVPALASPSEGICKCYPPLIWNGQECVQPSECPCVIGHTLYEVGVHFEREDCSECICVLGGIAQCKLKECPPCEKGLRPVKSSSCQCSCEGCPEFTLLCPTSGECIADHLWCNGVMDCPDDEINCKPKGPTIETVLNITKTCPAPVCLPGYRVKIIEKKPIPDSAMFSQKPKGKWKRKYLKSRYSKFNFQKNKYNSRLATPTDTPVVDEPEKCIEFICVPEKMIQRPKNESGLTCQRPTCPDGYNLIVEKPSSPTACPTFDCEPLPQQDAVCNVTGRIFNTFDGTEFRFDVCSHILAREFTAGNWTITLLKNCSAGNFVCTKEVEITDTEFECILTLYSDLTVKYNGYIYTVEQLQKGKDKLNFGISKVGGTIVFVSYNHGFWVTLDEYGDLKIGVNQQYSKHIDGLCGFFNGHSGDDRRLPNGNDAKSTVEFAEAWYVDRISKDNCQPHSCPQDIQESAVEICNAVSGDIFSVCEKSVPLEKFRTKCIETVCECLRAGRSAEMSGTPSSHRCKCSILQAFVRECLAADDKVHLDTWRSTYDCEKSCPPSLVHRDCFRRRCEPSCNNLKAEDCIYLPGTCFAGCYCPEGTVRKGDKCVNPSQECRDCVCDGFGQSEYVTYDRSNFTFDGNCTYLLTRDLDAPSGHIFEVFATLGQCKGGSTCTEALHILHNNNILHLQRKKGTNKFDSFVNGAQIKQLPFSKEWLRITEEPGKLIRIILPLSAVEVTSSFDDMSFSIRVPSLKYGGKMEGLCGDCNGDPDNDLVMNKEVQSIKEHPTIEDIVTSWQIRNPALNIGDDECVSEERIEINCLPLPPDSDPCMKILDQQIFGQCHLVLDPIMYVSACQRDLCRSGADQKGACESLSAYGRECAQNGICIDWRKPDLCPYECPAHLQYQACGCRDSCEAFLKKDEQHVQLDVCTVNLEEGCFCSKGNIINNGVCILPKICKACDADGHFAGDVWYKDKCNKCECYADGKIICTTTECPAEDVVCLRGFRPMEAPAGDSCCKKFICVPEEVEQIKDTCPLTALPRCAWDQVKKIDFDANNCTKIICECRPASECPPLEEFPPVLTPGHKIAKDTTGCCPTANLVCDKSLCPPKMTNCTQEFYELVETKAKPGQCCDEIKCVEPKLVCIVEEKGKSIMRKIGEKWKSPDPCLTLICSITTDGSVTVGAEIESCDVQCKSGFKYTKLGIGSEKCCGECVQSHCKIEDQLYEPGFTWKSLDNCTNFRCDAKDNQMYIVSEQETCPKIDDCPSDRRYTQGCCTLCKPEISEQKKCLPEVVSEADTVGLVSKALEGHGQCRNLKPLPLLDVLLTCTDGHKFNATVPIPQTCNCSQCPGV